MADAKPQRPTLVQTWKEAVATGAAGARCDELIRSRHAAGDVPRALVRMVAAQPRRRA